MPRGVSAIVLAFGPDERVELALQSLARQAVAVDELVVMHEHADEGTIKRRTDSITDGVDATFVRVGPLTPGQVRNLAVRRSRGDAFVVVDAGTDLDPQFTGSATAACLAARGTGFVASPSGFGAQPGTDPRWGTPSESAEPVTPEALLVSPFSLATVALINRSVFEHLGGFDESLPALVDWDLLIGAFEAGESGLVLSRPFVRLGPDGLPAPRFLRADRHLPALRQIYLKHRSIFERAPAAILTGKERLTKVLWDRERELLDKRSRLRAELASTVAHVARLKEELRPHGRDTTEWGDLRRTSPVSRYWGLDRGRAIDRYYIEGFLSQHAADIRGVVLEVLDAGLTSLGGETVERSDVLDIDADNRRATVIADLREAGAIPSESYDCFILTQTLHLIDDIGAAIAQAYRILRPGGVLLATLPSASMVAPDCGPRGDHWRVTEAAAHHLFEAVFPPANVTVEAHGNVFAATAFLYGLSCEEVDAAELQVDDPAYPLVVTVRAVKPAARPALTGARLRRPVILLYHRVATPARDVHGLAVSPGEFAAQVEELARDWHPMRLSDLAEANERRCAPDGAVALTFDDGYLDNLQVVLPILERHGVPATFFVNADGLEDAAPFWWDVLEEAMLGRRGLARIELRIDGATRTLDVGDEIARRASHDEVYALLKAAPPVVRDDMVRQLARVSRGATGPSEHRRMAVPDLRRLAASPLADIGAHGLHHLSLPMLAPEQLFREVFEVRSELERILDRPIASFSYPYGDVSPESVEVVRAADYSTAVTCAARALREHERPLELPRLEVTRRGELDLTSWLVAVCRDGRG